MAARLKRNLGFLKNLKVARAPRRKLLLEHAQNDQLKCISDCCLNILNENIKLSPAQRKRLSRHAKIIRLMASRRKGATLSHKKRLVQQNGGVCMIHCICCENVIKTMRFRISTSFACTNYWYCWIID